MEGIDYDREELQAECRFCLGMCSQDNFVDVDDIKAFILLTRNLYERYHNRRLFSLLFTHSGKVK